MSPPSGAASGADQAQGQGLQSHDDTSGGGDADVSSSRANNIGG